MLLSGSLISGPPSSSCSSASPTRNLRTPYQHQHTMSQSASPYPNQSSFYSTPPMSNPALNADTPPPPPPKPSSHEASRGGTPQNTSMPPQQPSHAGHQLEYHQTQPAYLPAPPTIEEGWLPELVKDKSYADSTSQPVPN